MGCAIFGLLRRLVQSPIIGDVLRRRADRDVSRGFALARSGSGGVRDGKSWPDPGAPGPQPVYCGAGVRGCYGPSCQTESPYGASGPPVPRAVPLPSNRFRGDENYPSNWCRCTGCRRKHGWL